MFLPFLQAFVAIILGAIAFAIFSLPLLLREGRTHPAVVITPIAVVTAGVTTLLLPALSRLS